MNQDEAAALAQGLQELGLATMRVHYEAAARQAASASWSYPLYLLELVQQECQEGRQKRVARWLKASKLPLEKSWQTLDLKRLPLKVGQQLRGLLRGDFLDRQENVLLFGPPGAGKTHALCAVSQELIRAGRRVLFTKGGLLVQEL